MVEDQTFSVDENAVAGTVVGTVAASDVDAGQDRSYALSGTGAGDFSIDGNGEITVATPADFETTDTYTLTVTVTDDGTGPLSDTATITINVNDLNDAPVVADQTFSVPENSANGTVVDTIASIDVDAGDTRTTVVTGGTGAGIFAVNPVSGQITVTNGSVLDFEGTASHTLNVEVTDAGGLNDTAVITINLTDVNEAPTAVDLTGATTSLDENSSTATTTKLADIDVTDDAMGTETLTLSGADAGSFEIVNGTGGPELHLSAGVTLDFETQDSYIVTVEVDDTTVGSTPDVTTNFTLSVNDVNEAPTAVSLANTVSLPEGTDTSSAISAQQQPTQ